MISTVGVGSTVLQTCVNQTAKNGGKKGASNKTLPIDTTALRLCPIGPLDSLTASLHFKFPTQCPPSPPPPPPPTPATSRWRCKHQGIWELPPPLGESCRATSPPYPNRVGQAPGSTAGIGGATVVAPETGRFPKTVRPGQVYFRGGMP